MSKSTEEQKKEKLDTIKKLMIKTNRFNLEEINRSIKIGEVLPIAELDKVIVFYAEQVADLPTVTFIDN